MTPQCHYNSAVQRRVPGLTLVCEQSATSEVSVPMSCSVSVEGESSDSRVGTTQNRNDRRMGTSTYTSRCVCWTRTVVIYKDPGLSSQTARSSEKGWDYRLPGFTNSATIRLGDSGKMTLDLWVSLHL